MENVGNYVVMGFAILGVIVTAGSAIVKLTPSQADDAFWAKVVKIADAVSVFNPNRPKV